MRDQHSDNEIASWIQAGESRLPQAAANNKLDAIRFMLELGFPTSTALFEAAWNGHMDVAKLLVDHGVSASQRHKDHSATPIDYADAADHMELRDVLLDREIDIFAAIGYYRLDRLNEILAKDAQATVTKRRRAQPTGAR